MAETVKYLKMRNFAILRVMGDQLAMGQLDYNTMYPPMKLDVRLTAERKIWEGMTEDEIVAQEKQEDMSKPYVPSHQSVYDFNPPIEPSCRKYAEQQFAGWDDWGYI